MIPIQLSIRNLQPVEVRSPLFVLTIVEWSRSTESRVGCLNDAQLRASLFDTPNPDHSLTRNALDVLFHASFKRKRGMKECNLT